MKSAEPPRLCGYLEEGQKGAPCYEPREGNLPYCSKHANLAFSICVGCGLNASRLCSDCQPKKQALCPTCVHLGPSSHGPMNEATPLFEGEPESGGQPSTVERVWQEYVEQGVLSLRESQREGHTEWETAERMVKTMAATSLINMMGNLARARGEGGVG